MLREKPRGIKQKLASAMVIIASAAVTAYDFLAPIVAGVDTSALTLRVPSWAWPLILIGITALFQFLRGGKSAAESISLVARNAHWQSRPNIREAILTNPRTPLIWFSLWLPGMKTADLRRIIASNRLTAMQRKLVEERLRG